jgi:hypothetical protein
MLFFLDVRKPWKVFSGRIIKACGISGRMGSILIVKTH